MGPRAGPSAVGQCKPEAAEGEHHWARKSKDHRDHLSQPLLEAREVAPQPYDQHASRPWSSEELESSSSEVAHLHPSYLLETGGGRSVSVYPPARWAEADAFCQDRHEGVTFLHDEDQKDRCLTAGGTYRPYGQREEHQEPHKAAVRCRQAEVAARTARPEVQEQQ